jgi:hypothetical protein
MEKITIKKEITIQSYGEFWAAFLSLKKGIDQNVIGWSYIKLSALAMACFTIEAFANHVGKHMLPSWDKIERGISPIAKLKLFNEMNKMRINYDNDPFNTVQKLMLWRNKVAHGKTEIKSTSHIALIHNYEEILNKIEQADWRKYVIEVDIEKIKTDCEELMKTIHQKAFGHLEWFLLGWWQSGSASVTP